MTSIGNHIGILPSVDSSNNYAMQQIHAGMAVHGQVWMALEQTQGKGQRGKEWKANAGENLMISVVLETGNLTIDQQFRLSATVAVAVHDFFSQYAGEQVFIKWPNDLYWRDRKAGGILIENVIGATVQEITDDSRISAGSGTWKWSVVGIGININQIDFPEHLTKAVSLAQITSKRHDLLELVKVLCARLELYWQQLDNGGWMAIYQQYQQHLYKKGFPVRLRKKNVVMPCTIRGVSEEGRLLIIEDEAVSFGFGEVAWEIG